MKTKGTNHLISRQEVSLAIDTPQGTVSNIVYHAKYFAHELTRRQAANGIEKLSMSLFDACVDLNPHQVEATLFTFRSPLSKGPILADEVGLGKTIEAGLVLCQYWAERRRKLLVICPASLRKQWSLELKEKFNLPAVIIEVFKLFKNCSEAFSHDKLLSIVSLFTIVLRLTKIKTPDEYHAIF
jgi:SNF2 family DNA or RNA helicase